MIADDSGATTVLAESWDGITAALDYIQRNRAQHSTHVDIVLVMPRHCDRRATAEQRLFDELAAARQAQPETRLTAVVTNLADPDERAVPLLGARRLIVQSRPWLRHHWRLLRTVPAQRYPSRLVTVLPCSPE